MNRKLLVIDDDAEYRAELRALLGKRWTIREAPDLATGKRLLLDEHPDVVLLDYHLPGGPGIRLLEDEEVRGEAIPIVMLSVNENPQDVTAAIRAGAAAYLGKVSNADRIESQLLQALQFGGERRLQRFEQQRRGVSGGERDPRFLVGDAPAMRKLREEIARYGPLDADVVVTGESGSGKELVARALHAASGAPPETLIDLYIPSISESMARLELFGHKGGAFSDVKGDRIGCVEAADGGTLMLDEVAEVPLSVQPLLLRVLQERTFRREGEDAGKLRTSRFRTIAVTQEDLDERVKQGLFRRDLLHRLRTLAIRVPPLRERLEDVPAIARHFLERNAARIDATVALSDGAAAALMRWEYRDNNVRELENVLVNLAVRADSATIEAPEVERYFAELRALGRGTVPDDTSADLLGLPYGVATKEANARFCRRYLRHMLARAGGVIAAAARAAAMHRAAFSRAMTRYCVRADDPPEGGA